MKNEMCQIFGRTIKEPTLKEMKKFGQRNKQEQKRKGMGRSCWSSFLIRKVLPTNRRNCVKKKKGNPKKEEDKEVEGVTEKGNREAKQQKKDERGQRIEKFKGVGKVKLIKGRNLPKEEGRDEKGSLEVSEWSGMLQKKGRIWKNTHRRSGNQEIEEEDKKERIFWKKGHQNSIIRACTYLERESKLAPVFSQQKVRT